MTRSAPRRKTQPPRSRRSRLETEVLDLYSNIDQACEEAESDLRAPKPLTEALEKLRAAAKTMQSKLSEGATPGKIRDGLRKVESAARRAQQVVDSRGDELRPDTRRAVRQAYRRTRALTEKISASE